MIIQHQDINHFRINDSEKAYEDILSFLNRTDISFLDDSKKFRENFNLFLIDKGYATKVPINPNYKMGITAKRGNTGICLQLGNTARFHSDLLKLSYLYSKNHDFQGIIIVPEFPNGNRAYFEKSIIEAKYLYGNFLNIPLRLISINEDKGA